MLAVTLLYRLDPKRPCLPRLSRFYVRSPLLLFMVAFFTSGMCSHAADTLARPNIVLIMADDLGWTDLGCFGSGYYQTPNLDRLCGQGLKFTSAYTCGPNCAPTRACLMSGLYTPRHGVYTVNTGARGKARFRRLVPVENKTALDLKFVTVAEVLQQAGYLTGLFGKWHLGNSGQTRPEHQGFEYVVAGTGGMGHGGYFSPYQNPQLADGPRGENITDRLSAEVVRYLNERGKSDQRDKPFFVYLPYFAVHSPWQGKPELIERYRQRKPAGGHDHPTYAAMIETLDTGVGRVLKTLDDLELAKNTLVIFYSDNGGVGGYREAGVQGAKNVTSQAPLRGGKGMLYEGGIRVPMIVRWPGVTRPGSVCDTPITSVDFLPTLADIAGTRVLEPCDGISFSPLLRGQDLERKAIYWHFPGYLQASVEKGTWRTTPCGAVRDGQWKLIEFFAEGQLELYNLQDDLGETMNLAAKLPDKTSQMHAQLQAWRKEVHAPMPKPKPTGDEG